MGTGNSDSVPWVKINHEDRESAKSRIYGGLTRMRSDRVRRRSWRWFPVFYLSKLIPESSEFPVPLFWKAHPKTLRSSVFCCSVRKFPSQFLMRQKERGALTAETADDSGQAVLVSRIWSAVFLTIPDFRKKTWPELYQSTSLQPRTTAVFTIKSPFWFCSMRNCERDSTLEKRE